MLTEKRKKASDDGVIRGFWPADTGLMVWVLAVVSTARAVDTALGSRRAAAGGGAPGQLVAVEQFAILRTIRLHRTTVLDPEGGIFEALDSDRSPEAVDLLCATTHAHGNGHINSPIPQGDKPAIALPAWISGELTANPGGFAISQPLTQLMR